MTGTRRKKLTATGRNPLQSPTHKRHYTDNQTKQICMLNICVVTGGLIGSISPLTDIDSIAATAFAAQTVDMLCVKYCVQQAAATSYPLSEK